MPVSGVVFCSASTDEWSDIELDNFRTVKEFTGTEILGKVPRISDVHKKNLSATEFRNKLRPCFKESVVKKLTAPESRTKNCRKLG